MDGIKNLQAILEPWVAYLGYCFNDNPLSVTCEPFWERIIGGFVLLGAIAVVVCIFKYLSYRRKFAAAMREYDQRNAVDEEAIREKIWAGEKAYQSAIPDEEIGRRVREGLEQRRREVRNQARGESTPSTTANPNP